MSTKSVIDPAKNIVCIPLDYLQLISYFGTPVVGRLYLRNNNEHQSVVFRVNKPKSQRISVHPEAGFVNPKKMNCILVTIIPSNVITDVDFFHRIYQIIVQTTPSDLKDEHEIKNLFDSNKDQRPHSKFNEETLFPHPKLLQRDSYKDNNNLLRTVLSEDKGNSLKRKTFFDKMRQIKVIMHTDKDRKQRKPMPPPKRPTAKISLFKAFVRKSKRTKPTVPKSFTKKSKSIKDGNTNPSINEPRSKSFGLELTHQRSSLKDDDDLLDPEGLDFDETRSDDSKNSKFSKRSSPSRSSKSSKKRQKDNSSEETTSSQFSFTTDKDFSRSSYSTNSRTSVKHGEKSRSRKSKRSKRGSKKKRSSKKKPQRKSISRASKKHIKASNKYPPIIPSSKGKVADKMDVLPQHSVLEKLINEEKPKITMISDFTPTEKQATFLRNTIKSFETQKDLSKESTIVTEETQKKKVGKYGFSGYTEHLDTTAINSRLLSQELSYYIKIMDSNSKEDEKKKYLIKKIAPISTKKQDKYIIDDFYSKFPEVKAEILKYQNKPKLSQGKTKCYQMTTKDFKSKSKTRSHKSKNVKKSNRKSLHTRYSDVFIELINNRNLLLNKSGGDASKSDSSKKSNVDLDEDPRIEFINRFRVNAYITRVKKAMKLLDRKGKHLPTFSSMEKLFHCGGSSLPRLCPNVNNATIDAELGSYESFEYNTLIPVQTSANGNIGFRRKKKADEKNPEDGKAEGNPENNVDSPNKSEFEVPSALPTRLSQGRASLTIGRKISAKSGLTLGNLGNTQNAVIELTPEEKQARANIMNQLNQRFETVVDLSNLQILENGYHYLMSSVKTNPYMTKPISLTRDYEYSPPGINLNPQLIKCSKDECNVFKVDCGYLFNNPMIKGFIPKGQNKDKHGFTVGSKVKLKNKQ